MPRPHLIRADTMDLQDSSTPSAQDHTRQPSHPAPAGEGPRAPHQASTLKIVGRQSAQEQSHSPHTSIDISSRDTIQEEDDEDEDYGDQNQNPFESQQDEIMQQNGPYDDMEEDAELADAEGDDDMLLDDDMDKISSSPSIEDGGLPLPSLWPTRGSSLTPVINRQYLISPFSPSSPQRQIFSPLLDSPYSSSFLKPPQHPPVSFSCQTREGQEYELNEFSEYDYVDDTPSPHTEKTMHPQTQTSIDTSNSVEPEVNKRADLYTSSSSDCEGKQHDAAGPLLGDLLELRYPCVAREHLIATEDNCNKCIEHHKSDDRHELERSNEADDNNHPHQFDDVEDNRICHGHHDPASRDHNSDNNHDDVDTPTNSTSTNIQFNSLNSPNAFNSHDSSFGVSCDSDNNDESNADTDSLSAEPDLNQILLPDGDPLLNDDLNNAHPMPRRESQESSIQPSWALDGETSEDDDLSFSDERFTDSGWGGECLREIEDIDFEFVYALHTFVATVEGQANATKGDTMVLLDDSNSYWWLVRVVKDGSIGYLPAEHIETPTERLARLNKHRNIDLSHTMLGDNPEKSKNPLKKAMRRRQAKTVTFNPTQTYVEASDHDYSSDEDEEEGLYGGQEDPVEAQVKAVEEETRQETVIEPLRIRNPNQKMSGVSNDGANQASQSDATKDNEVSEHSNNLSVSRSRNGTLRNTDSFFKDDTVETKKISLTPKLLSEDSLDASRDSQEAKLRPSLDTFDKITGIDSRTDKKRKDKKSGMLSGLFKRKDKKNKQQDDGEMHEKISGESTRSLGSKDSKESFDSASPVSARSPQQSRPARSTSKLQKQNPNDTADSRNGSISGPDTEQHHSQMQGQDRSITPQENAVNQAPGGGRRTPSRQDSNTSQRTPSRQDTPSSFQPRSTVQLVGASNNARPSESSQVISPANPDTNQQPSNSAGARPQHQRPKPSPNKLSATPLSPVEEPPNHIEPASEPTSPTTNTVQSFVEINHSQPELSRIQTSSRLGSLNESPIEISPTSVPTNKAPSPLRSSSVKDDSYQQASSSSVSPSIESTPSLIDHPSPAPETSPQPPTPTAWSDALLRTYMDDDTDVKDLLIIVHDRSNVKPAGPDHPITGSLFKEERRRLGEMGRKLDGLLAEWLMGRKGILGEGGRTVKL